MKILYLSLNPNLQGPFPKIDPLLIAALQNSGHQVTKLAWGRHSENETLAQKFLGRFDDLIRALSRLIREQYDILYVVTTLDEYALARDIPLLLTTYWFPVKKVVIMHGTKTAPLAKPGPSLYKFLTRLLIRLSDAILLLSTKEQEIWTDFEPKGRYYRILNPFIPFNPLALDRDMRSDESKHSSPILLFVGRLIKEKGIYELLDAMKYILNEVDCRLLIAGDGEEKMEILRWIEKENLSLYISLLGYLESNQLDRIYQISSVFILPSYREGFPTSIMEAMGSGLPIITTPVGAITDYLCNETHTLFVQPRNSDAIANAVIRLLNDPQLCSKMRRANFEKVQEFKPEKVVPKYVQIFHELLDKDSER